MAVLKRKRRRPVLNRLDRLFWIMLRNVWPRRSDILHSVKPATVIAWHRRGFRLYWRWRSRQRVGRPRISEEVRCLIRQMRLENPDWGAPKIHGELLKLGFQVSEPTVARYLQRLRPRTGKPDQRWKAVLANDREAIVAFRLLHGTHLDVQTAVLFLDLRAWPAEGAALQRDRPSDLGMDRAAVAGSLLRRRSLPVGHLRPRLKIQCRGDHLAEINWLAAEAHEHSSALAERNGGAVDGKLPARDAGPPHPAE
jgi:Homeodomain-like domain